MIFMFTQDNPRSSFLLFIARHSYIPSYASAQEREDLSRPYWTRTQVTHPSTGWRTTQLTSLGWSFLRATAPHGVAAILDDAHARALVFDAVRESISK